MKEEGQTSFDVGRNGLFSEITENENDNIDDSKSLPEIQTQNSASVQDKVTDFKSKECPDCGKVFPKDASTWHVKRGRDIMKVFMEMQDTHVNIVGEIFQERII